MGPFNGVICTVDIWVCIMEKDIEGTISPFGFELFRV